MKRLLVIVFTLTAILAAGYLALRRADIPYDTLEKVYANQDSQFLTLNGEARLHYRDVGPRDAPAIVLVHGFSASLHTWEDWATDLKQDYRVISLDLPGHGLTRCPDVSKMGITQFVSAVDQTLIALGADKFTLVGNSMGGATAWNYTLAHPDKVDAMVLVDASGWPEAAEDSESEPFVFKLLANPLARSVMKDLDLSSLIRSGLEDSFTNQSLVTDEMVKRYASLGRAPCHREAILKLMSGDNPRPIASKETLAAITAPTLILHGSDDNLVPVGDAIRFDEAIPNTQRVIYENVGHLPQEEVASQSVSDLRDFLTTTVHLPTTPAPDEAVSVE